MQAQDVHKDDFPSGRSGVDDDPAIEGNNFRRCYQQGIDIQLKDLRIIGGKVGKPDEDLDQLI
jgi:hypothetical protein